jgi:hypothetical protein
VKRKRAHKRTGTRTGTRTSARTSARTGRRAQRERREEVVKSRVGYDLTIALLRTEWLRGARRISSFECNNRLPDAHTPAHLRRREAIRSRAHRASSRASLRHVTELLSFPAPVAPSIFFWKIDALEFVRRRPRRVIETERMCHCIEEDLERRAFRVSQVPIIPKFFSNWRRRRNEFYNSNGRRRLRYKTRKVKTRLSSHFLDAFEPSRCYKNVEIENLLLTLWQ